MTVFDKVKGMTIDEMAEWLTKVMYGTETNSYKVMYYHAIRNYLLRDYDETEKEVKDA